MLISFFLLNTTPKEKSHSRLLFFDVQGITEIIYKCIEFDSLYSSYLYSYQLCNRTCLSMNMKIFEMREKRLAELLGAKVLREFISAVTEEIEKQELESTPGLLENLLIYVKETIQIQNMNRSITKAPVKTAASSSIDKDTLFMEVYVELINHKFVISELAIELSSVLKELNCFVQSSLPLLQNKLDSQEPQPASLWEVNEVFLLFLYTRICYSLSLRLIYCDDLCTQVRLKSLMHEYLVLGFPCIHLLSSTIIR